MDIYSGIFKALSDETRLRILHILIVAKMELCACEFTDVLEVPAYNISKHIKILKTADLIAERKEGRWVYYKIKSDKSPFHTHIYNAVLEMENPQLKKDIKELEKRLKLRIDGSCPVGIQKIHLKSKSGIKCC
jgi:ArsR family transcriptional regulator, arsenate/arsenite/antimonite-responsive transcriptional repressor